MQCGLRIRTSGSSSRARWLKCASTRLSQQLPHIATNTPARGCEIGRYAQGGIRAWFETLAQRLRRTRVVSGDWKRVMGDSVLLGNGVTGVMLDPPYALGVRTRDLYAYDATADRCLSTEAREWALAHGDDPRLRIALCGYEAEHAPHIPPGWECVAWKANGGYGNASGNQNKHEERIWFSPHCLRGAEQLDLLGRSG